jgi:hypothetical protein
MELKSKVMEKLSIRVIDLDHKNCKSSDIQKFVQCEIRAAIREYDEMIEGASMAAAETEEWGTDALENRRQALAAFEIKEGK